MTTPPAISTVAWFAYGSPIHYERVEVGLGIVVFYGGEYCRIVPQAKQRQQQ